MTHIFLVLDFGMALKIPEHVQAAGECAQYPLLHSRSGSLDIRVRDAVKPVTFLAATLQAAPSIEWPNVSSALAFAISVASRVVRQSRP